MVREVRTPAIAQVPKQVGFDFLMLDMAQGAGNLETAAEISRVARPAGSRRWSGSRARSTS